MAHSSESAKNTQPAHCVMSYPIHTQNKKKSIHSSIFPKQQNCSRGSRVELPEMEMDIKYRIKLAFTPFLHHVYCLFARKNAIKANGFADRKVHPAFS